MRPREEHFEAVEFALSILRKIEKLIREVCFVKAEKNLLRKITHLPFGAFIEMKAITLIWTVSFVQTF